MQFSCHGIVLNLQQDKINITITKTGLCHFFGTCMQLPKKSVYNLQFSWKEPRRLQIKALKTFITFKTSFIITLRSIFMPQVHNGINHKTLKVKKSQDSRIQAARKTSIQSYDFQDGFPLSLGTFTGFKFFQKQAKIGCGRETQVTGYTDWANIYRVVNPLLIETILPPSGACSLVSHWPLPYPPTMLLVRSFFFAYANNCQHFL